MCVARTFALLLLCGRSEIFGRPFPNVSERREKVSVEGGRYPAWGPGSGELFYADLRGGMMATVLIPNPLRSARPQSSTSRSNWLEELKRLMPIP